MEFTHIMNLAIAHKSKIETTRIDYEDNLLKIEELEKKLQITSELYKNTEYASTYLEKVINEESEEFTREVQSVVNLGLETIFFDKDYKSDFRTDGLSTAIHLVYTNEEGHVVDPDIRSNVGGGVRTVVGTILQVFFINYFEAEPLIFVDEGFSAIDSEYLPYFMGFIEELSNRWGLKLLLVTHDERITSYSKKVYMIDNGVSHLVKGNKKDKV